MTYVVADIHGCYDKYVQMLEVVRFTDDDTMFVLGDVVDRGPEPVKVLQDMMVRPNVFPIIGNHEYVALSHLSKLLVEITEDNYKSHYTAEDMNDLMMWFRIGGEKTLSAFARLPVDEREYVYEYIQDEFALYEIVPVNGKTFILTHAGVPEGATLEGLLGDNDYDAYDFVMPRINYNKQYFSGNVYLVVGHTPTKVIDSAYEGKIYRRGNNINIDAGAVFGGKLACLCLDTDEEFYV